MTQDHSLVNLSLTIVTFDPKLTTLKLNNGQGYP